ncbi:MAG: aspartate--tRNA ligase [Candidatus Korobacteraceae bacterium]
MALDFLGDLQRTHTCGALRPSDAGKQAILMGWVHRRRDLGSLIFIDVRDRTGLTQVVFDRESNPAAHEKAGQLRSEYVIAVTGTVKKRDADTVNANIATGDVELAAGELRILNTSQTPPFSPAENDIANEEMRLRYRYIDLRREPMQYNIEMRHKIALAIRQYLAGLGFFEIETPFMTRSTPEGARDYLVPSRVHPGSFYALPQSPQLFKQILMISGFDRYFQIVRCFRDEDLRADRQPEFTQIDLEMTFPHQEQIFAVVEGFLKTAFEVAGVKLETPFRRMTYDEAIRSYGSDKPDLRLPAMTDVREAFSAEAREQLKTGDSPIMAIRIPKVGDLSRKERDDIRPLFGERKDARLFEDAKRLERNFQQEMQKVYEMSGAQPDDLVVLVAGSQQPPAHPTESIVGPAVAQHDMPVYTSAGALRIALAQKYADRHKLFEGDRKNASSYHFLWVTDFPMFEWSPDERRWEAAHHPFTSPHDEDMEKLSGGLESARSHDSPLGSVRALAYDVVLNGTELGSGSIRIHRQDIQQQIFRSLGMGDEEARARFGFFLEALTYGTPPHGGIALGLDRIVMILAGADSLREVIPFPKTAQAKDLMVDAPTPVSDTQLRDLGIRVGRKD